MATANERKALWFLALVVLSGSAVRLWRAQHSNVGPAASAALDRQIRRVDSVREVRQVRHKSRDARRAAPAAESTAKSTAETTAAPGARVDLDRATEAEIETLPGIGPAIAKRIVAYRDSAGSFGALEGLCDVRGIGPALVERLRPLVTFSGPRRPVSATCGGASKKPRKTHGARTR